MQVDQIFTIVFAIALVVCLSITYAIEKKKQQGDIWAKRTNPFKVAGGGLLLTIEVCCAVAVGLFIGLTLLELFQIIMGNR